MMRMIAAALCLLAAGCADQERGRLSEAGAWAVAAANPVGPPASCVERSRIRGTAVRDDRTIDFQLEDGQLLRNRLPQACAGLTQSRFIYRTALDRLCSTDTITLVDAGGRAGGSCGLGMFQPIAVPPRPGSAGE